MRRVKQDLFRSDFDAGVRPFAQNDRFFGRRRRSFSIHTSYIQIAVYEISPAHTKTGLSLRIHGGEFISSYRQNATKSPPSERVKTENFLTGHCAPLGGFTRSRCRY